MGTKLCKAIGINTLIGFLDALLPAVGQVIQCIHKSLVFSLFIFTVNSTGCTSASLFSETSVDIVLVLKSLRILLMLPMVIFFARLCVKVMLSDARTNGTIALVHSLG